MPSKHRKMHNPNYFSWKEAPSGNYAVIGDPISHSLSPDMFDAAFKHHHLDLTYHRILVQEDEFDEALNHLSSIGYHGLNVTLPLKSLAYEWVNTREPDAESSKSVNCIQLDIRAGNNTDISGIKYLINSAKISGKKILILGNGGAAKATVCALQEEYEIAIWARTPNNDYISSGNICYLDQLDLTGFDAIIHATSAYRAGESLAFNSSQLKDSAVLFDLDYSKDRQTPFLSQFPESHAKYDGSKMLVKQGALAFKWWTQLNLDEKVMEAAISKWT